MFEKLTLFSIHRPRTVISLMTLITILFGLQFPSVVIERSNAKPIIKIFTRSRINCINTLFSPIFNIILI